MDWLRLQGHAATALARSAVSKALHTREVLALIISHRTTFDLIAAANANDFFYNCAVDSPIIQQALLLRSGVNTSPQCYRLYRSWTGNLGSQVRTREIGLTPSAGMSSDDTDQSAEPCTAVRLCPALRPMDAHLLRENIATPTDDLRKLRFNGNERLLFTAGPSEVGRLLFAIRQSPGRASFSATNTLELLPRFSSIIPVRRIPNLPSTQSSRKLGVRPTVTLCLPKMLVRANLP